MKIGRLKYFSLPLIVAVLAPANALSNDRPAHAVVGADYFAQRDSFDMVKVSLDGKRIGMRYVDNDRVSLVILDASTLEVVGRSALPPKSILQHFTWASDGGVLIDTRGSILWVDGQGRSAVQLDRGMIASPRPDQGIIQTLRHRYDPVRNPHSLHSSFQWFGGRTEHGTTALLPFSAHEIAADRYGRPRWAVNVSTHPAVLMAFDGETWTRHAPLSPSGKLLRYSGEEEVLYIVDRDERDRPAVFAVDRAGKRMKLAEKDGRHPSEFVFDEDDRLVAMVFEDLVPHIVAIVPQSPVTQFNMKLNESFPTRWSVIRSIDRQGQRAIAAVYSDRHPTLYLLLDIKKQTATRIASAFERLRSDLRATSEPVILASKDGHKIRCRLTQSSTHADRARGLVVMPSDDIPTSLDRDVQLLAANGYSVLRVQLRGLSKYGQVNHALDPYGWILQIQADISAAAQWAIDEQIVDQNRICIMGRDFGAYVASLATILYPGLFSCAVVIDGLYDLERALDDGDTPRSPVGRQLIEKFLIHRPRRVAGVSPLHRTAELRVPMLVAHAEKNRDVLDSHADDLATALKHRGVFVDVFKKPVTRFDDPATRAELYRRIVRFLHQRVPPASE